MKLIIKNNNLAADLATLKAIDTGTVQSGELKYVVATGNIYKFQPLITDAGNVRADDDGGDWELQANGIDEIVTVQLDSYNEATNNDENISELDNWIEYGPKLIKKKFYGFKDWKCLRDQILKDIKAICGDDLANFDSLTDSQEDAALVYIPTYIIAQQGQAFFVGRCPGADQNEKTANANTYVDNYIIEVQGDITEGKTGAYKYRWRAEVGHFYSQLGATHGLELSDEAWKEGIYGLYTKYGVLLKTVDGKEGFTDWLYSQEKYGAQGTEGGVKYYLEELVAADCPDLLLVDPTAQTPVKLDETTTPKLSEVIDTFLQTGNDIVDKGLY